MNPDEMNALLASLIDGWENEVVEFKAGGDGFSTSEIGKYFSALSNEANLRGVERALARLRCRQQDPQRHRQ